MLGASGGADSIVAASRLAASIRQSRKSGNHASRLAASLVLRPERGAGIAPSRAAYRPSSDAAQGDAAQGDAAQAAAATQGDATQGVAAWRRAIDDLIATELTIIFAPKEWQSTGPASLAELIGSAPRPRKLVVLLVPPLTASTTAELKRLASSAWEGTATEVLVVHEPDAFRNAYDLRNEAASLHANGGRYVLHLNNDCVGVPEAVAVDPDYHWLRELVGHAEREPGAWAVMPLLLERAPYQPLHMHAWWASVVRAELPSSRAVPRSTRLHARFDSQARHLTAWRWRETIGVELHPP